MKRHQCVCGTALFFDNTLCLKCDRALGFDPESRKLLAIEPDGTDTSVYRQARARQDTTIGDDRFRRCNNGVVYGICNWLVPAQDAQHYCRACRLNQTIPNLDLPENIDRWRKLEQAKRRLIYTLLDLSLPFDEQLAPGAPPLRFNFSQDQRTDPTVHESFVATGHFQGLITINAGEADRLFLEQQRQDANQDYRTLLGHFRHESGHYFFDRLIRDAGQEDAFRDLFGDERASYQDALDRFYTAPPGEADSARLRETFVSVYASMHPHEDWAETWAHFLHIADTLETAAELGFAPALNLRTAGGAREWLDPWTELSIGINELNRSMGVRDAYPFILSNTVRDKLEFVRREVIRAGRPT